MIHHIYRKQQLTQAADSPHLHQTATESKLIIQRIYSKQQPNLS
jgi:hypothetical protein